MQTSPLIRKVALTPVLAIALISLIACDSQTTTDSSSPSNQTTLVPPSADNACGTEATFISEIQGNSDASPLVDQSVSIEASITTVAPNLNGLFVQEEAEDIDDDPMTSEGLFVLIEQALTDIEIGQLVRITGVVQEVEGRTQMMSNSSITVCGTASIESALFELPNSAIGFEAYEGMVVQTSQSWVINSTHNISRFGELGVSSELLFTPTHLFRPGSSEAADQAMTNRLSRIILDDFNAEAPDRLDLYGEIDSTSSLRIGSRISSVQGILDETFNTYRIRLTESPLTEPALRPDLPTVEGDIVIAAFNVLNLFNGDGQNGEFPTDRGAKNVDDFARQQTKIVNAILQLSPDIIGLNEIENDADQGELSAVFQLTQALNSAIDSDVFDYLAYDSAINGASIANAIIYRKDKIEAIGETKVLTSENSASDGQGPLFFTEKSRPAITQAFAPIGTNNAFVVSVNHLKSKGSPCGEDDDSDEQGNCNLTRTRAAQGLAQWLDQTYAGLPVFIIGDLNSYAQEDPIQALRTSGYTDVIRNLHGAQTYTYSFRGQLGALDYVMANEPANDMVVSAFEWHINAAEPRVLDYNSTLPNSDEPKPDSWLSENVFRSSDHDPVVVAISVE